MPPKPPLASDIRRACRQTIGSAEELVARYRYAGDLADWLPIMMIATPVMYPTSTGRENRSARTPTGRGPPQSKPRPTNRAGVAASARSARCRPRPSARARPRSSARSSIRSDGQLPGGAEPHTRSRHEGGPQPDDWGKTRERRVGHHLRHEIGRDRETRHDVSSKPDR